jgi:tetratricopeptide (TPR) repeat protein
MIKSINMKKRSTYLLLILCFLGLTAFVVIKYNVKVLGKTTAYYPLLERKGQLAQLPEWPATKEKAANLIAVVRDQPKDVKSRLSLASVYIQEGRVTGKFDYYNEAAMTYINEALLLEPKNFEGLLLKAVLQLSQHHFDEALQTAQTAEKISSYNAFLHGIMVDAYVEKGDYDKAVQSSDKMISIRPDIRSYSRVSYLREIHGDYPGAIEAMIMAVESGTYGDEATAWTRTQLAQLYEKTGDLERAKMHYTIVLDERPGFAYALAGMGNLAAANNDYAKAISLYGEADAAVNDYALKEKLAELYIHTGQKEKGDANINSIITELTTATSAGEEGLNHHADKELAYVYLLNANYNKAVDHALAEYRRRPGNIEVNEAVAWAYYKKGDIKNAVAHIEKALKTNCKNPTLLCRAALIYAKGGNAKAKTLANEALKNPNIDAALKEETKKLL